MALNRGVRLGPYEVSAQIGTGGMGEVYRARDTRLERNVALKVLPDSFARDADRLARFQREAKTLAALNHPHIGAIHGVEESDGICALVLELVEGPTLADRIAQGPLPLDEALPIARQIAEALEAAHEQGIIHRDLKPANIKVRSDGAVKVLDFGLAKVLVQDNGGGADEALSQSPTLATPAVTGIGVIMGTAAYMSPEQARGKRLDKRTDVWSFGCVLYEMLTGRRAFAGSEVSDVIASILAREPDLTALPADVPPSIRRLLRRCLQKDRNERLRDIGDARIEIRDALTQGDAERAPAQPDATRGRWMRIAAISTTALMALVTAAAVASMFRPPPPSAELRLEITTPPTPVPGSVAISPDGRTVAFVATSQGQSRLWLRALESSEARPLAGTERAQNPFWSPDNGSIGFFADNKLKRVDINGGAVRVLTNVYRGTGGAWSKQGVILFASLGDPISRIPAEGGDPHELPGLPQEGSNFTPRFLPDGQHFLYYLRGSREGRGVYVGRLDGSSPPRRLLDSDAGAVYAPPGYLLFVRDRALFAQGFDAARLALTGNPFTVAQYATGCSCLGLTVSDNGSIAFRSTATPPRRQFVWFDRAGKEVGKLGDAAPMFSPSLSPDGLHVVGYRGNPADGNVDVWMLDTRRAAFTRLTVDPGDDVAPTWSPDGSRVAFSSNREGTHHVYVKSANGSDAEELLFSSPDEKSVTHWTSDGLFVLFDNHNSKRGSDIFAVPLTGERKPFAVAQTPFDEHRAQTSPDGNWVAFQSDESGRDEIYVQPFPGPGSKWPVSTGGGTQVRWRPDGKELFYVALDGRLMAVPIQLASTTNAPEVGAPVPLFAPPLGGAIQQADFRHQYMVSRDGQRFLIVTAGEGAIAPITIILNWKPTPLSTRLSNP